MPINDYIAFAHRLADAAGAAIRPYFGKAVDVETKLDNSPVSIADRQAEATMRSLIEKEFPNHGIYGEEYGLVIPAQAGISLSASTSGEKDSRLRGNDVQYTWVIDPIDGTRAFLAGKKEWGTLIALCENGVPILGILDQPVTGERWVGMQNAESLYYHSPLEGESNRSCDSVGGRAAAGSPHGCAKSTSRSPSRGELSKARPCPSLAQAEISTTSRDYFTPLQAKSFAGLAEQCGQVIAEGDCYAYGLLARGARDLVVDAGLKPYDILALVPIIEAAGGIITAWDGAPITLAHGDTALAAGDSALHAEALRLLQA